MSISIRFLSNKSLAMFLPKRMPIKGWISLAATAHVVTARGFQIVLTEAGRFIQTAGGHAAQPGKKLAKYVGFEEYTTLLCTGSLLSEHVNHDAHKLWARDWETIEVSARTWGRVVPTAVRALRCVGLLGIFQVNLPKNEESHLYSLLCLKPVTFLVLQNTKHIKIKFLCI